MGWNDNPFDPLESNIIIIDTDKAFIRDNLMQYICMISELDNKNKR